MKKRILSLFLALVMLFSCLSLNIFATEEAVAENTEAAAGSVIDQSIKDHTADKQLESIVKRLTTVSGQYQVNLGTGGITNNNSTRAKAVNGRIVLGARADTTKTATQSFVQLNSISNAGNRNILSVYNGHYATGRSFVIQVGVEITEDFVKDTKGHFGLIQPTTYLTNSGRDGSKNNQVGTWMSHIIKIGSNATEAGNGTQASLLYMNAGSYDTLMNIEPGKTYNVAVSVNPQDVDAGAGIYGGYDIYVNGELVKERASLLSAGDNANMAALSNSETPKAFFVDGSYSDSYNTFATGASLTAYFFLPVGTVLDDKTDTDEDGIPDLYENVKGITAESAKSIKGYECIGTVDGVQDFTLGFVRIAQTDGAIANWGSSDYMYLDNIFTFFADEYFDPISHHNFYAQAHTHDYTLETVDVKYVCEYCNSYKTVTEAIDANGDRVCDVCVGGLEEGGILSMDELADLFVTDDIRYTNDFGTGGSHGFHGWYNDGNGLTLPAENGDGYLLYGPTTGDTVKLYGQFHVSGGDYNAMRAWPLNNFNTYRGRSYVVSTDIMRYEGCETGTGTLFNLMCYAKLNAAGDGFDYAGAFSPVWIEKDGTLKYRDANNVSYNSGVTLKAGVEYNVAIHHTPKTNTYDI